MRVGVCEGGCVCVCGGIKIEKPSADEFRMLPKPRVDVAQFFSIGKITDSHVIRHSIYLIAQPKADERTQIFHRKNRDILKLRYGFSQEIKSLGSISKRVPILILMAILFIKSKYYLDLSRFLVR